MSVLISIRPDRLMAALGQDDPRKGSPRQDEDGLAARLLAGATVYAQAVQSPAEPHWLYDLGQFNGTWLTPGIRLLAAVALVWFCVWGRWGWRSRSAATSGRLPELLPTT